MPSHVIHGDSFLVPSALFRLKTEAGIAELLEANHHQVDASQIKPADLFNMCGALPFMDTHRLIVISGLLARHERRSGERRAGRGGGRGQAGKEASTALGEWEQLTKVIQEMPETTVLVFLDGPVSEANPLLRLLRPISQVQSLSAPTGEGLARWIKESAKQKGASISPAALGSLTDMVGNDLWTLDQELEKLALYAFGRAIEEADVTELVSQVREANIFNAVDAMIDGRPVVALKLLRQLRQDGQQVSRIIAMVERQLRLLALARDAMDQGLSQAEIGKRLGVSSQFVIRKTVDQARRHDWQNITSHYHRLLEADLSIKRGVMEPDLALELLVAEAAPIRS